MIRNVLKTVRSLAVPVILLVLSPGTRAQDSHARVVSVDGYDGCIELMNEQTRVVLDPNAGGRVLRYERNGKNILQENPSMNGKIYVPGEPFGQLSAGRIDVGPQQISPPRPVLFFGRWKAGITGKREGVMVSQEDTSTGLQLTRYFRLDDRYSQLEITQTMRNVSSDTIRYCYWGRSFAKGGGISLTPLNPHSRFPKGYIIHGPGPVMDYMPVDEENVRVRDGILEIIGPPERPKFGMDSYPGWLAYISRDSLLFIKKFPVYSDRVYGEMAGYTSSIWYNGMEMVEIEPLGPMEVLAPGAEVSFTVHWYLLEYEYPADRRTDLDEIRSLVADPGNV